jgi:hypothetical protein
LQYNGTNWVNSTISTATTALSGLTTDVLISSAQNGDTLVYNSTSSKWNNSSVLSSALTNISNLQLTSGVVKNATSITSSTPITTSYVDNTDGSICKLNDSSPFYNTPISFNKSSTVQVYQTGTIAISGNSIINSGGSFYFFNPNGRMNVDFGSAFVVSGINITIGAAGNSTIYSSVTPYFNIYGGNAIADYNDVSDIIVSGTMTLLLSCVGQNNTVYSNMGFSSVSNATSFRYIIFMMSVSTGTNSIWPSNLQVQHASGGYANLINGTDFTIASSVTNGSPVINYTPQGADPTTATLAYNENTLLLSEAYRRLYPVIYDTNNLRLGGQAGWNLQNNGGSLLFNYNGSTKTTIDTVGN